MIAAIVVGSIVAGTLLGVAILYLTVSLDNGRCWDGTEWPS